MKLLDCLPEKEKKSMPVKKFGRGENLFHEDEVCKGIGILVSGRVKIVSYSFSGGEIVYKRLSEGEMFGANLVFSSEKRYRGSVVGESRGSLLYIGKEDLVRLMQTNRDFLLRFLEMQSDFGKELNLQNKILAFNSADERLAYYLHANEERIEIESIAALARKLGLERETLSRLIHAWQKEGKITFLDGVIQSVR